MSTDPSGAATARDDLAVAEPLRQAAAIPPRDLAELAAVVDHLEAIIAAAAGSEVDGSDAVERIADIAFVLHERDVEASLCDSLDAAVRDLGNAGGRTKQNVGRMRQAAELLRELSRRVNDIIARSLAAPTGAEEAGQEIAVEETSDGALQETGETATAVTEPSSPVADQTATASDSPDEPTADAGVEPPEDHGVTRIDVEGGHEVPSPRNADLQGSPDTVSISTSAEEACSQAETAKLPEWRALADPEDDPGDLFEPQDSLAAGPVEDSAPAPLQSPMSPPPGASASFEHTSRSTDESVELELTPPVMSPSHRAERNGSAAAFEAPAAPTSTRTSSSELDLPAASHSLTPAAPRAGEGGPSPEAARQSPDDPLAALRALSEEELVALFS
jgi:hypothetical protein